MLEFYQWATSGAVNLVGTYLVTICLVAAYILCVYSTAEAFRIVIRCFFASRTVQAEANKVVDTE